MAFLCGCLSFPWPILAHSRPSTVTRLVLHCQAVSSFLYLTESLMMTGGGEGETWSEPFLDLHRF